LSATSAVDVAAIEAARARLAGVVGGYRVEERENQSGPLKLARPQDVAGEDAALPMIARVRSARSRAASRASPPSGYISG
jgi:hypothetical protein